MERVQQLGLLQGLEQPAELAASLFGIMIGWRHNRWQPKLHTNPKIGTAEFTKALRPSARMASLRQLRMRLLEEFGTLHEAFEYLGAGDNISFEVGCETS